MAKQIRCSYCGNRKWMLSKFFKMNLHKFGVVTLTELNNVYICRKCTNRLHKLRKPSGIRDIPEFRSLQKTLQTEVDILTKRGLADKSAMNNFQMNINSILDKHFIFKYTYEISNNILVGIVVNMMPLYGDLLIELNVKGKHD